MTWAIKAERSDPCHTRPPRSPRDFLCGWGLKPAPKTCQHTQTVTVPMHHAVESDGGLALELEEPEQCVACRELLWRTP